MIFAACLRDAFSSNSWTCDCPGQRRSLVQAFLPLGLGAAALMAITLVAQLASTNLGVSFKRLAPSGAKFNPLNRLKELPKQNVPAALQALALMGVMGYVLYLLIVDNLPRLLLLPLSTVSAGVAHDRRVG